MITKKLIGAGFVAAAIVAASSFPAQAQAPPEGAAVYNWTGWYVGLNGGNAWGHSNVATSTVFSPVGYFATTSVPSIKDNGRGSLDPHSLIGGIQSGYNWQTGNWVLGVEADFEYFPLDDSRTVGPIGYPCCAPTTYSITQKVETDWLFTLRPRLGLLTADNWLVYITGGLALTRLKTEFKFTDTFAAARASASESSTEAGWTVGTGVEVGLAPKWTLRAEYLHVDFGRISATTSNLAAFSPSIAFPANPFKHSADLKSDIVRAAINFRF